MGILKNLKNILNKDSNFKPYDKNSFSCKCGCGTNNIYEEFIDFMNYLYKETDTVYEINSGVRCINHNKKVGGKENSDHIYGKAIDVKTLTIEDRSLVVYYAFKFGIPRAIVYTDKYFVHLSINENLTCPILLWNKRGEVY